MMERLTKRVDGIAVLESWVVDKDPVSVVQRLCSALAAYEDTGLEPEDIVGLKNTCDQLHGINDNLFKANQEMGKDLAEWKKAHDEGRLIVLPCKVGDHVWVDGRDALVTEFFGYRSERYFHAVILGRNKHIDIPFCEIGKTVFLTREEAEAALKETRNSGEQEGQKQI